MLVRAIPEAASRRSRTFQNFWMAFVEWMLYLYNLRFCTHYDYLSFTMSIAQMDWNLVRLYVDVVEAGSLSEAARRRGITRSGVSQRLRRLEQDMGAQLLRRTTRNLQTTEIGQSLYEHGRRIAMQFEAARHDVESLGKSVSGLVRLSLPPGIGATHIAPALLTFAEENPSLSLNVTFNNRLIDMIDSNVDIALRIVNQPPEDLVARELCSLRWQLYCTPRYRDEAGPLEHPSDLERVAFLTSLGARKISLTFVSPGETAKVALTPRFTSENVEFLRACMLRHMGVAMLPEYVVRDAMASGECVRLLPRFSCAELDSKFFILTMPNRFPTPAMNAVIELLRETVCTVIGKEAPTGGDLSEIEAPFLQ
jgi:DNA-binding transcriptional LysR family regulator